MMSEASSNLRKSTVNIKQLYGHIGTKIKNANIAVNLEHKRNPVLQMLRWTLDLITNKITRSLILLGSEKWC